LSDWESSFSGATEVAGWWAFGEIDPDWVPAHEMDVPSVVNDIKPGETLSGFEIRSPCAPSGLLTWYARGYVPWRSGPPTMRASGSGSRTGATTRPRARRWRRATATSSATGAAGAPAWTDSWGSSTSPAATRCRPERAGGVGGRDRAGYEPDRHGHGPVHVHPAVGDRAPPSGSPPRAGWGLRGPERSETS
jgi:hypothetical protein